MKRVTRRTFLILGKHSFVSYVLAGLFCHCNAPEKNQIAPSLLASVVAPLIGYLLYEENIPPQAIPEITQILIATVRSSPKKEAELKRIVHRIDVKTFENATDETRKKLFKNIMSVFASSVVVLETLSKYLQGDMVLEFLDYAEPAGGEEGLGECGWMLQHGPVWERYYPE